MTQNPFDHARDEALGATLRAHLEGTGHAAFVARVRGALRAEVARDPFDVLGSWMRPGIAAAAVVALLAGWWLRTGTVTIASSATPVEVFATGGGADVILATAVEGR